MRPSIIFIIITYNQLKANQVIYIKTVVERSKKNIKKVLCYLKFLFLPDRLNNDLVIN